MGSMRMFGFGVVFATLCLGLGAGSPGAGEMTAGLEMLGGKNAFSAFHLNRVEGQEEGLFRLRVDARETRELQGYGFVLHFDEGQYEFVEAQEVQNSLLDTEGGKQRLFFAVQNVSGQVAVGAMKVDGQAGQGDGGLVEFTFRTRNSPFSADFHFSDGVLVDLSGELDAVLNVETGNLKPVVSDYRLDQNTPNPFNPSTTIAYQLPEAGQVRLAIYNMLGQEVRRLVDNRMDSGSYTVTWNGRDALGREVASGVYMYRLEASGFRYVRWMMLLK